MDLLVTPPQRRMTEVCYTSRVTSPNFGLVRDDPEALIIC
jgi:hypothetical protein